MPSDSATFGHHSKNECALILVCLQLLVHGQRLQYKLRGGGKFVDRLQATRASLSFPASYHLRRAPTHA